VRAAPLSCSIKRNKEKHFSIPFRLEEKGLPANIEKREKCFALCRHQAAEVAE